MPGPVIPRQGFLRDSVAVTEDGDSLRIAYSLWQVSIPRAWVVSRPALSEMLQRKLPHHALPADSETEGLISLLAAQGCFHQAAKADYSLAEVRTLFDPLRSAWYASYYAHPLWKQLRSGEASRNELLAWVIHNYHISRAAGVVGARMASRVTDSAWRAFFRHDALDEFWHCDAYYFVKHPSLSLDVRAVKEYVPLSGSLAFELHTLRTAERDHIGHLLIAYFQESSIVFYEDSKAFYRAVDEAYGLPGFFTSWEQHIRIDQEHGHADGLAALFEPGRRVSSRDLHKALRNAWLAYWFLRRSLDDIQGESLPGGAIRLRHPGRGGTVDTSAFRDVHSPGVPITGSGSTLEVLERWATGLREHIGARTVTVTPRDITSLLREVLRTAFESLGHAREHDDLMAVGRLAEGLARLTGSAGSRETHAEPFDSPWCVVLAALLAESATNPAAFLAHLWALSACCAALPEEQAGDLRALTALAEQYLPPVLGRLRVDAAAADRLLTALVQLEEFFVRWLFLPDRFASEDFTL